jgi:predicted O-methyltransferase YrrM
MRALQGDPVRHQYFLPVVRRLAESQSPPMTILEVGSWAGASAVSWAKAFEAAQCAGTVICVDTWSPYFDLTLETATHCTDMDEAARAGSIFQLFLHNIRACGVEGQIQYCVGDSREVLRGLPAESFDLIYVDGSHRCDVVRSDLAHAKRLLHQDGILCGDDLELQRREVDPEEHLARVAEGLEYVFSRKAGTYYHPGVTEAVVVEIGDVSAWDGFWAVQKRGTGWRAVELDLRDARIPDHIQAAVEAEPAVVGETASFNLVRTSTGYLALAKSLGPTKPLVERLGERDLGPLVLVGTSLEEIQSKMVQAEAALPGEASPSPELGGQYSGFNLVRYGGKAYGLRQTLGQVDVPIGDAALRERYGPDDVIIAGSVEEVTARIDAQPVEQAIRELSVRLEAVESLLREKRGLFAKALKVASAFPSGR